MLNKLSLLFKDGSLMKRIFFTLFVLVVFRALAAIPIPGVDQAQLAALFASAQFGQFLGLVNTFSGGGLSQLSIVMLGVGPYITASIIMQLLTIMSPRIKAMYQEEGEMGRRKFVMYSRLITLPLAIIQAWSFLALLEKNGAITQLNVLALVLNIAIVTAGSFFLMWLGERISEDGVGNGTSMIIFSGIVASFLGNAFKTKSVLSTLPLETVIQNGAVFAIVGLVVIAAVVFITEAERPIPVTYAKRVRGNKVYGGVSTYLPIRLNQAGVIPIIFALSFLLFPQILFNVLSLTGNVMIQDLSVKVTGWLNDPWIKGVLYFVLVFAFTYFYTAVTFDPKQISDNLQKNGAFIPGVRPGESTMMHLAHIITRLTLVGALFLGVIAVLPSIVSGATGITTLAVGGTSILIVVSVVLELLKKVDAQLTAREY